MKEIMYTLLYSVILACSLLCIWHKLTDKKINYKDHKLYITLIGITLISIINYFAIDKFLKIITITIIFMFFFYYLFRESLQKSIITPIYYQLIIMISETLYAILLIAIFKSGSQEILSTYFGTFVSNVVVAFISILISNLHFVKKLYKTIILAINKIKNTSLLTLCLVIIIALSLFPIPVYYQVDIEFLIIFYSIMIVSCFAIVLYSFKIQKNYNEVSGKYNIAIKSLKDYEDMMSKYRLANHENKNLLLTVRAMILNKENDIPKYIDTIIEDKFSDDEKLLFKMSVIPSGGLRGAVYSEILKIKDNNIKYSLNIDKNLKTIDLINLETEDIINICKIIGVFIDNAIEEVLNLKKKDRNIVVSIYMEEFNLNIKISNNYASKINIDKLAVPGYTTKDKGHGYGLTLVKKIIDNNKNFTNITEINKNIFSQILSITICK